MALGAGIGRIDDPKMAGINFLGDQGIVNERAEIIAAGIAKLML